MIGIAAPLLGVLTLVVGVGELLLGRSRRLPLGGPDAPAVRVPFSLRGLGPISRLLLGLGLVSVGLRFGVLLGPALVFLLDLFGVGDLITPLSLRLLLASASFRPLGFEPLVGLDPSGVGLGVELLGLGDELGSPLPGLAPAGDLVIIEDPPGGTVDGAKDTKPRRTGALSSR